jgi:hypothetical protein
LLVTPEHWIAALEIFLIEVTSDFDLVVLPSQQLIPTILLCTLQ